MASTSRQSQTLFLAAAIPVALVATILAVRLVIVVASTPSQFWSDEFVPVVTSGNAGGAGILAGRVSSWIGDEDIARSLMMRCGDAGACLDAVDYGLAVDPASSELWLQRATLLANSGSFGDSMVDSLARSYATGPNEGWIAASRLPFALRLQTFLPDAMLDDVGRDVAIVVASHSLAGPLIEAYIADPLFRDASWPVIERYATLDQQQQLIDWIRGAL